MNNYETIEYLKQAGFDVRVEHYRNFDGEPTRYFRKRCFVQPDTTGGITIVALGKRGGIFMGHAFCSVKDNYCYKEGVRIALERALTSYADFLDFASELLNVDDTNGSMPEFIVDTTKK